MCVFVCCARRTIAKQRLNVTTYAEHAYRNVFKAAAIAIEQWSHAHFELAFRKRFRWSASRVRCVAYVDGPWANSTQCERYVNDIQVKEGIECTEERGSNYTQRNTRFVDRDNYWWQTTIAPKTKPKQSYRQVVEDWPLNEPFGQCSLSQLPSLPHLYCICLQFAISSYKYLRDQPVCEDKKEVMWSMLYDYDDDDADLLALSQYAQPSPSYNMAFDLNTNRLLLRKQLPAVSLFRWRKKPTQNNCIVHLWLH